MNVAFVFPGQGAQYVGMGRLLCEAYPIARETFAQADEALGFPLSSVYLDGPVEELRLTYHTQPAILTVSVACWRVFCELAGTLKPVCAAGHSLGEYSALVAAGTLAFTDAVRLVRLRGNFMDEAVPAGQGAMAAVLGADTGALADLCADVTREVGRPVEVANVNCPGQLVVSGDAMAVRMLTARAQEAGARRAIALDVSGPFHSVLMQAASVRLARELEKIRMEDPSCPVIANVDARPKSNSAEVKEALARQVASPVLWEASVKTMIQMSVTGFVEFGPGTVLSSLIKKTDRHADVWHVEDPESLERALAGMGSGELRA